MGLECTNLIGLQEAKNWLLLCLDPLGLFVLFFYLSWGDMVIILDEGPVSLPGAAKIMLTVPNGGRGATSLW